MEVLMAKVIKGTKGLEGTVVRVGVDSVEWCWKRGCTRCEDAWLDQVTKWPLGCLQGKMSDMHTERECVCVCACVCGCKKGMGGNEINGLQVGRVAMSWELKSEVASESCKADLIVSAEMGS